MRVVFAVILWFSGEMRRVPAVCFANCNAVGESHTLCQS